MVVRPGTEKPLVDMAEEVDLLTADPHGTDGVPLLTAAEADEIAPPIGIPEGE